MSRRDSPVDTLLPTDYSAGDSNKMNPKTCQEENNNDIDQLSKDLSAMGCIVDAVKKPNICIEHCIHEESDSEDQNDTVINNEEDGYSDEFEDDKSDDEGIKEIDLEDERENEDDLKRTMTLIKSQSSTSTNKPPRSVAGSVRSSSYGSLPVPKTNRINMSFTNDRLREIERHNHILLNKIISARNVRKSSIPPHGAPAGIKPVPAAAVMRRNAQRKIDHDNMILLKKLQRTKSSSCSLRR
ncbi:unnamed protein product [Plutella xylostella]|uniref:(diamondback moth) hypothetical protein n=1 Tax=Plutella xylostella TaxID=51655 RepID=A0A8S4FMZ8_PLUXY|nr:unnamed protein product [Plutella xylostella]